MKTLRNILYFALIGMLLASCGASSNAARSAEKEAERQAIVQAIENCDIILDITQIIPRGFPSRVSSGEYQLRLEGDVVTTRLPFFGTSHEAQYGGTDEISIVFDKEKVQLAKDFSDAAKKGEYRFQFKGGKSGPWTVTLQIYDNGSASIGCAGTGGKYMSYFANLRIPEKNDEK